MNGRIADVNIHSKSKDLEVWIGNNPFLSLHIKEKHLYCLFSLSLIENNIQMYKILSTHIEIDR